MSFKRNGKKTNLWTQCNIYNKTNTLSEWVKSASLFYPPLKKFSKKFFIKFLFFNTNLFALKMHINILTNAHKFKTHNKHIYKYLIDEY